MHKLYATFAWFFVSAMLIATSACAPQVVAPPPAAPTNTSAPQTFEDPFAYCAVVDVWDALLSDRPYRKAWSRDQVIAYFKEQSGKQFDPRIVERFLKLQHESLPALEP